MSETLGFIGLGIMGRGMALNLLKAGYAVHVWNRSADKMQPLIDAGATAAESPRDVAAQASVIFICVSDTPDVQQVIMGDDGVIHGAQQGALVVDTSTISPQVTRDLAHQLMQHGIHMVDAPISGGSEGAAKGTLSIMVGGDAEQVTRAMPYLQAMGKTITHVGGHGAGQTVKLVNQILVVGNMLAVSEALLFAQANGVDLEKTLQAVGGGAAGSWMLNNRGPQVITRDWRPGFTIDLQQKDLRLVMQAADASGTPAILTSLIFNLYRTLQAQGLGSEGNHALIKALEQLSNITVTKE